MKAARSNAWGDPMVQRAVVQPGEVDHPPIGRRIIVEIRQPVLLGLIGMIRGRLQVSVSWR